MDWQALTLSFRLGLATVAVLVPAGVWLGRALAYRQFRGKGFVEAAVMLPLLLPPTVLGFYLLVAFSPESTVGALFQSVAGHTLAFSFDGLLLASILINIPFVVQPIQRAFEAVPVEVREAAACCGMNRTATFSRIELPLAWPGIMTALVLAFAHTLGEFGVVLMVGGAIPGETRTISIAIYDRVQAFDDQAAGVMAATLLVITLLALGITNTLARRIGRQRV